MEIKHKAGCDFNDICSSFKIIDLYMFDYEKKDGVLFTVRDQEVEYGKDEIMLRYGSQNIKQY